MHNGVVFDRGRDDMSTLGGNTPDRKIVGLSPAAQENDFGGIRTDEIRNLPSDRKSVV